MVHVFTISLLCPDFVKSSVGPSTTKQASILFEAYSSGIFESILLEAARSLVFVVTREKRHTALSV